MRAGINDHDSWESLCISNGKCSTKEGDVAKAKELLKKETKETIDQVLMIINRWQIQCFARETKAYYFAISYTEQFHTYDVFIADIRKNILY